MKVGQVCHRRDLLNNFVDTFVCPARQKGRRSLPTCTHPHLEKQMMFRPHRDFELLAQIRVLLRQIAEFLLDRLCKQMFVKTTLHMCHKTIDLRSTWVSTRSRPNENPKCFRNSRHISPDNGSRSGGGVPRQPNGGSVGGLFFSVRQSARDHVRMIHEHS